MCGITGFLTLKGTISEILPDLENATDKLRHRGPDNRQTWTNNISVGLGHTRLSILDLSEEGNQPMISKNHKYIMVYNGEIYNFLEIKKKLEAKGYFFKSSSDSEVILTAFEAWGEEALGHFIGMFAIALWDNSANKLFLFRDRAGVKPLYYGWENGFFCFGSELKALKEYSYISQKIDYDALGEFFQYGYISAPRSIFKGIKKLPPGHMLEIKLGEKPHVKQYWSILSKIRKNRRTYSQNINDLEELLTDAFNYRMVSDVPVGVFLSGGIDSSLVSSILQKTHSGNIKTFTIGFKDNLFDESIQARNIAKYLRTEHHEFILDSTEAKNILPKWADLYDEPFGDSSGIPTYLVSKKAREYVKVILSADGGDELFGGYPGYCKIPRQLKFLNSLPNFLNYFFSLILANIDEKTVSKLFQIIPAGKKGKEVDRIKKLSLLLNDVNLCNAVSLAQSKWLSNDINNLIGHNSYSKANNIDSYPGTFEEKMMIEDFHYHLPDDILTKVDRATMAVGLEGREPFLDHRVIEFAFNLHLDEKIGRLGNKHILRDILYKYIPRELVDRPKQGFSIPIDKWMRGNMKEFVKDNLNYSKIKDEGILDPDFVREKMSMFFKYKNYSGDKIWYLLAFELWLNKWIK